MNDVRMLYFKGFSGKKYRFYTFSTIGNFKKSGGLYILTKRDKTNNKIKYEIVFIGKTHDLSSLSQEEIIKIVPDGKDANCICVKMEDKEKKRCKAYSDLRKRYAC